MKQCKITKMLMTAALTIGMFLIPAGSAMKVQASEVIATVQGTILSGTTSELLLLSTSDGKMEIKLDSNTDASGCKILLPDKKITVSLSHESDGYLHAVKITTEAPVTSNTLDSSTTATVRGTIGDKTTDEILCLKTPQGDMEIKMDPTTDTSGCSVLVVGKTYAVTCARGSDAYMHAISISDTTLTTTTTTTGTVTPSNVSTMSVTGTVSKNTTEEILYLSTSDGEMQFKIDSNANTIAGMIHTPGNKLTVTFYHGSDGYLHAVATTGVKETSTATVNTSSTTTVTGTVKSKSTENILYFDTPQGEMELKLDAVTTLTNCKVLVSGKKLTITCAYGSDAYMHAITITA